MPMEGIFNGIKLHYEVYGEGNPFILLHGNGEDISIFETLVKDLQKDYEVYAIDTRAHGKSESAPIHYDLMAEDVKCFIEDLGLTKPIVYGFSDGGIVGLTLASKYPQLVGTLISSGANVFPKGIKWFIRYFFILQNLFKPSPLLELMIKEPNLTEKELNKITCPTLILTGSRDMIPIKHSEYIAKCVPNATLTILKKETHGSYVINSEKLYPIIKSYLN
jgi:pimeloyl-ACP methyl ester carboxylesterase